MFPRGHTYAKQVVKTEEHAIYRSGNPWSCRQVTLLTEAKQIQLRCVSDRSRNQYTVDLKFQLEVNRQPWRANLQKKVASIWCKAKMRFPEKEGLAIGLK
jgi:hypothetical protein